jgi:glycosyltransferase involved in cell wall biosynthesis
MISIIIPAHNNLRHLKNAYQSIKKHAPNAEIVLLDDASTDGTWEWIIGLDDTNVIPYKSPTRDGHTVLYDLGVQLATNEIVGIMHADMIIGQNYVENTIKHLKPKTVVCGTRVEPPLHPAGPEKIIMDFGLDFDSLNIDGFESFVDEEQVAMNGVTSKSMFAPWVIYKEDFNAIGGHDWGFAPFPYEDSDIFQRWLLAGYELIQSRDAFVYHLTCRGHRWTKEIGKNDDYFTQAEQKAKNYYIKKWGSWISNDEYQHPILIPVYNKSIKIINSNPQLDQALEPWFNGGNDILVEADGTRFTQEDFNYVMGLNQIIEDSGEIGQFELGNLKITINKIEDKSKDLIFINNTL